MPKDVRLTEVLKAAQTGDLELLKKQAQDGYLFSEQDNSNRKKAGELALHIAAASGHFELVVWLIEEIKIPYNGKDEKGETILHVAARNGNLKLCQWILKKYQTLSNELTCDGFTFLHCALDKSQSKPGSYVSTSQEQSRLFRYLLQNAPNELLEKRDKKGWNIIHHIAFYGQIELLKQWVLGCGIPIDLKTKGEDSGKNILHIAAAEGHESFLEHALFSSQVSLKDRDKNQSTPLLCAAARGHVTVVERLLGWGSSLNEKDHLGRTALLHAAYCGHTPLLKNLLSLEGYEVLLQQKDCHHFTALLLAAKGGFKEAMEFLLSKGASFNEKDRLNRNALHIVIDSGYIVLAEWLASYPNFPLFEGDRRGNNVLHYAIESKAVDETGRDHLIQYLIKLAPNLQNARGAYWRKPVHLAKHRKKKSTVALLAGLRVPAQSEILVKIKEFADRHANCINSSDITFQELLGESQNYQTFKGRVQGQYEVAIKKWKAISIGENIKEVEKELLLMSKLEHPNIIKLFGYNINQAEGMYSLILEYMIEGSLSNMLRNPAVVIGPWNSYLIALDIITGLAFLHEKNMIHRNLKTSNILLNGEMRAKISNFNFAKIQGMTTVCPSVISRNQDRPKSLDAAYEAPEVARKGATSQSDIYSYGVIMWELLTRRIPFEGKTTSEIQDMVWSNQRETLPELIQDDPMYDFLFLIKNCWKENPNDRTKGNELQQELHQIVYFEDYEDFSEQEDDEKPEPKSGGDALSSALMEFEAKKKLAEGILKEIVNERTYEEIDDEVCLKKFDRYSETLRFFDTLFVSKAQHNVEFKKELERRIASRTKAILEANQSVFSRLSPATESNAQAASSDEYEQPVIASHSFSPV